MMDETDGGLVLRNSRDRGKTWWYKRFRAASYVNAVVWIIWTVAIVLPFPPFSYLQPIVVGGGAGTWFLLAYLLFLAVSVVGFAVLASIVFVVELHERRTLNQELMFIGLTLLYVGTTVGFILLGFAGAFGGYALVIEHSTVDATHDLLLPYVNSITAACLAATIGASLIIYGMCRAKAPEP
jgi:hypothetical protein